jgi:hypothetical protein
MLNYKNKRQVEFGNQGRKYTKVTATCFCKTEFEVDLSKLRSGHTKSCGCLKGESHGMEGSRMYSIWTGLKTRTTNKNCLGYKTYGGRGIIMCPEWKKSFIAFYNDMKEGYSDDLTIDRIDNSGNYTPNNCRWATPKEQSLNKSNNIVFKGEYASAVSLRLGGSENLISSRVRRGWAKEKAFNTPVQSQYNNQLCLK